jgi:hypothetical protein
LGHDDKKISFLETQFFDLIIVIGGFTLKDNLLRLYRITFFRLNELFEIGDLSKSHNTVRLGSI